MDPFLHVNYFSKPSIVHIAYASHDIFDTKTGFEPALPGPRPIDSPLSYSAKQNNASQYRESLRLIVLLCGRGGTWTPSLNESGFTVRAATNYRLPSQNDRRYFSATSIYEVIWIVINFQKVDSWAENRSRTDNLLITNQLLCQLSYLGIAESSYRWLPSTSDFFRHRNQTKLNVTIYLVITPLLMFRR